MQKRKKKTERENNICSKNVGVQVQPVNMLNMHKSTTKFMAAPREYIGYAAQGLVVLITQRQRHGASSGRNTPEDHDWPAAYTQCCLSLSHQAFESTQTDKKKKFFSSLSNQCCPKYMIKVCKKVPT